jgi:arginine exporter protein ArgO
MEVLFGLGLMFLSFIFYPVLGFVATSIKTPHNSAKGAV